MAVCSAMPVARVPAKGKAVLKTGNKLAGGASGGGGGSASSDTGRVFFSMFNRGVASGASGGGAVKRKAVDAAPRETKQFAMDAQAMAVVRVPCPICKKSIPEANINAHIDSCLKKVP